MSAATRSRSGAASRSSGDAATSDVGRAPARGGERAAIRSLQHTLGNRGLGAAMGVPGRGRQLDPDTLAAVEQRFGHSFDHVRVHDDEGARDAADSFDARAFTHGSDIYFGEGEYAPGTHVGDRLLNHELAHVVQQARGGSRPPALDPQAPDPARRRFSDGLEHEAEAAAATDGLAAVTGTAPCGSVQTQLLPEFDDRVRKATSTATTQHPSSSPQNAALQALTRKAPTDVPDELRSYNEALLGTPEEIRVISGRFRHDEPVASLAEMAEGMIKRAPMAFVNRIAETAAALATLSVTASRALDLSVWSAWAYILEKPKTPGTIDPNNPGLRYLRDNPQARSMAEGFRAVLNDFKADRRPRTTRFKEGYNALVDGAEATVKRGLGAVRRPILGALTPEQLGGALGETYGKVSADTVVDVLGGQVMRKLPGTADDLLPHAPVSATEEVAELGRRVDQGQAARSIPDAPLEFDLERRGAWAPVPEPERPPVVSGLEVATDADTTWAGQVPELNERALEPSTDPPLATTRRPLKRVIARFGEPSEDAAGTFARKGAALNELNEAEIARGLRVSWDADAGRPRSVAYRVDAENIDLAPLTKRTFTRDVATEGAQSRNAAYANSGYDKGHLAQREAFKGSAGTEAAVDHFTNIVPMRESLNRGAGSPWRAAESRTIKLAKKHGSVFVKVIPIYDANPLRLVDGTPVPMAITRVVIGPESQILEFRTYLNR